MSTPSVDHRALPYRIAVLCYLYDDDGHVLMLRRRKDPNSGMYSPIGGKLEVAEGESPHACAVREIHEESGLVLAEDAVRLTGIVTETAYEGETHWLIFLFEVTTPVARGDVARTEIDEGTLEWMQVDDLPALDIPNTDREIIWPLVQKHRSGFFMVHIDCTAEPMRWTVTETGTGKSGPTQG